MQIKLKILCSLLCLIVIATILNVFTLKESDNIKIKNKKSYVENYIIISETVDKVLDIADNYPSNVKTIVYDNLTLEELSDKLNRSLNSTLAGKGELIATYSLEKGVDPYMAVAIMLQETGCMWDCSYLVKQCNNVGGQKGYGCDSYSYFETIDIGIQAFIDNLYSNYIAYGLTTPEAINPKYASDQTWSVKVNSYIEQIKAQ